MTVTTNKALFRVVGNSTSPSSARGYDALAGETLSFQLEDSTGVLNALWETYDTASPSSPLSSLNAPSFPFTANSLPAYTNGITPFSASATVPTPSGGQPLGNSYFVRCTVATARGSQTFTRSINARNGSPRKPVPGEVAENSLRGWADDWSILIENTNLHASLQPADGIHGIVSGLGPYSTAALRRAAVLTSADVGKCALQTDTSPPTMWTVLSVTSGAGSWGLIATAEAAATPLTIITSTSVKLWVDSALGTSTNAWNDQSGNANHFAEPTNPAALTTIGGVLCYAGDGVAKRFRNATLTVTAGQWYWIIARPIAWTGSGSLCGGRTSAYAAVFETGSSPQVSIYSGVAAAPNSNGAVGSWSRYEYLCTSTTGPTGDYLKVGSNTVLGSGGSNAETGWDIFCRAGTAFGNYAIAGIVVCPAKPTSGEITALNAWGAARWPSVAF